MGTFSDTFLKSSGTGQNTNNNQEPIEAGRAFATQFGIQSNYPQYQQQVQQPIQQPVQQPQQDQNVFQKAGSAIGGVFNNVKNSLTSFGNNVMEKGITGVVADAIIPESKQQPPEVIAQNEKNYLTQITPADELTYKVMDSTTSALFQRLNDMSASGAAIDALMFGTENLNPYSLKQLQDANYLDENGKVKKGKLGIEMAKTLMNISIFFPEVFLPLNTVTKVATGGKAVNVLGKAVPIAEVVDGAVIAGTYNTLYTPNLEKIFSDPEVRSEAGKNFAIGAGVGTVLSIPLAYIKAPKAIKTMSKADVAEAKQLYITLAKKYHPDSLQMGNSEAFKTIKGQYDKGNIEWLRKLNRANPSEAEKLLNIKFDPVVKDRAVKLLGDGTKTEAVATKPIVEKTVKLEVYRGEGGKVQNTLKDKGAGAMFGEGKYYADSEKYASKYGKVTKEVLELKPNEILKLDTDAKLDAYIKKAMQEFPDIEGSNAISKLATKEGYKAITGFDTVNVLNVTASPNTPVKTDVTIPKAEELVTGKESVTLYRGVNADRLAMDTTTSKKGVTFYTTDRATALDYANAQEDDRIIALNKSKDEWSKALTAERDTKAREVLSNKILDANKKIQVIQKEINKNPELKQVKENRGQVIEAKNTLQNPLVINAKGQTFDAVNKQAIAQAQKEGRDGVVINNVVDAVSKNNLKPITTVLVFDKPKTIKVQKKIVTPTKTVTKKTIIRKKVNVKAFAKPKQSIIDKRENLTSDLENEARKYKSAELDYIRNTEKAPKMGNRFGQDIEPAGKYINLMEKGQSYIPEGWEVGKVKFNNPLIIDWGGGYGDKTNWKNVLSERYGRKTGKQLSQAIVNDGYDGIITLDKGKPSEVVQLTDIWNKANKSQLDETNMVKDDIAMSDFTSIKETQIINSPYSLKFKREGSLFFRGSKGTPENVAYMFKELKNNAVESLYILGIKDNMPKYVELLSMGTINQSVLSPMDVLPVLIDQDVDGIYLVHNHPSGNPLPSPDDILVSKRVEESLATLSKKLYGHVVIDTNKFGYIDINDYSIGTKDLPTDYQDKGKRIPIYKKYLEWNVAENTNPTIHNHSDIANLVKGITTNYDDVMVVAFTDQRQRVIAIESIPTTTSITQIAKRAIQNRAVGLFLVNPSSSFQDTYNITKTKSDMARRYAINLIDVVGISDTGVSKSFYYDTYNQNVFDRAENVSDMGFNPKNLENPFSPKAKAEMDKVIKQSDIAKKLSDKLNVPIRMGKYNRPALGLYKTRPKVVRIKSGGLQTIFHEVGHYLDDTIEFSKYIELNEAKALMAEYGYTYEGKPAKQRSEGFAEYLRFKMTGQQAKIDKFAPTFDRYFESKISTLPDIKSVIDEATAGFKRWAEQPSTAKVLSQISIGKASQPSIKERAVTGIHDIYTAMLDDIHPLNEFSKLAKKRIGNVPAEKDPYILARNLRGWTGKADLFFNKGTFGKQFYKLNNKGKYVMDFKGKSYSEIMKPLDTPEKLDDFRVYIVSQRIVNDLEPRGIKTGIDIKDAKQALEELDKKYPDFEQIAKDRREYKDQLMNYAEESGLIGKDGLKKMRELNKYHVPFYRVMEEAQAGFLGKRKIGGNVSSPIKKIKGSEREIIDPFESDIKDTLAIINASERNSIGIAMANLAKQDFELGRLFEQVDKPMQGVKVNAKEVMDKVTKQLGEDIKMPEELADIAVTIFRPTYARGNNMLNINMGDKQLVFEVDPDLYKALQGLDVEDAGLLMRLISLPAKVLRAGATLTPDFSLRNPLRDQFTAMVYSKYGFTPGIDLLRGMFQLFKKDNIYDLWKASGGDHASMVSLDRNYLQKSFKEIMASKKAKTLEYVKNPLKPLQILSELGEAGTRLGEMRNALAKGASPIEAGLASREITLDFARIGAKSRAMNLITAFWNANLQGTDTMIRSFKNRPYQTLLKTLLGITLPSVLLYMANKDDPRWKEIPTWQKNLFWIILTPDHVYRIPKPFELGIIFGSAPERLLEYIEEQDPKVFKELQQSILDGFTPGYLPTALLPIIENITNYSFFTGRSIVSRGQENLPAEAQAGTYTSEVAKIVGEALGYSPSKVDNLVQGYTGGLGKYTTQALDEILKGTGVRNAPVAPAKTLEDTPVLKAFMIRKPVGTNSESVNRVYEMYGETSKQLNMVKKLAKEGNVEEAKKYAKEHPEVVHANLLAGVVNSYSEMNKAIDAIRRTDKLSAEEKRDKIAQIAELQTEIAQKALAKIKELDNE